MAGEPESRIFQNGTGALGKRDRTRSRILDAAVKVIAERGTGSASILEITAVANVANGTFYYHFKDKEELLKAIGVAVTEDLINSYQPDWSSAIADPAIQFAESTRILLTEAAKQPMWCRVIIDALLQRGDELNIYYKGLRAHIEYGLANKRFDTELTEDLLSMLMSINRTALILMLEGRNPERTLVQAIEAKLRILGIAPEEAREIAEAA